MSKEKEPTKREILEVVNTRYDELFGAIMTLHEAMTLTSVRIDNRLDGIDNRLYRVERRMTNLEDGFGEFRKEVDRRFNIIDARFDAVDSRLLQVERR